MPEALLSIRNLTVQYGRFLAVDALSFELSAGSLLGMIGPNGAGKTTTLRAAAGLLAPSGGAVRVMGYDVFRHATAVGNHLGFAPDSPAVYDSLTVQEFLQFIGDAYGMPRRLVAERIDMWLEQLWLAEKRRAKISSLSRGMRQRLTVARTLLPDPHVILLDEPAAGLDPAGRMYFRKLLAGLRDQGKAIIVSSHILADLAEYCTHILIMERGRARRFGTVAQVTDDAGHDRCLYRVQLSEAIGDVAARIAQLSGLTRVALSGDRLDFEYLSDRPAAARLLRGLLDAGLPVAAFHPLTPNLEEAYLRTGIGQVD